MKSIKLKTELEGQKKIKLYKSKKNGIGYMYVLVKTSKKKLSSDF